MSLKVINGILKLSKKELNLKSTLKGGMSFRWNLLKENDGDLEFVGVSRRKIFILKQSEDKIEYSCYFNPVTDTDLNETSVNTELEDYFRLNENLDDLFTEWSKKDVKFKQKVDMLPQVLCGIRVLRLDPVENLFSFICSSNNNIKRITQMVSNMCIHFGSLIGKLESNNENYYSFPTVERLAQSDVEEKLRKLNFGYRAKFISKAAIYLKETHEDPVKWLYSLRGQPYDIVQSELIKIPGIGKKVADCIGLMSLDKLEAIPVDTHVLSIARNTYKFVENDSKQGTSKTNGLSDKMYKNIG